MLSSVVAFVQSELFFTLMLWISPAALIATVIWICIMIRKNKPGQSDIDT